jgi:hypothetical protein
MSPQDKDPYVVVLIDGDGSKFLDDLLQDPVSGAAEAAQRLKQEIKDYLKDTPLGAVNLPILVRVFANVNDLARSLRLSNVIESADDMRTFAEQFTNSRAEFDFINVGRGKENADSKMRSEFPVAQTHARVLLDSPTDRNVQPFLQELSVQEDFLRRLP